MEGVADDTTSLLVSEVEAPDRNTLTEQFQSLNPKASVVGDKDGGSTTEIRTVNIQEIVDFSEIDPISSKSTSISELEDGQILESSSDCSDVGKGQQKLAIKRHCSSSDLYEGNGKKAKKKISFSEVTAYYFPRAQGFTCIPSQGGSTLGMELKHTHVENLTLSEHSHQQRKNHRK